jgi:CBS domain-containing protein
MSKAYEVMTHRVATCSPDTSIAEVASIMRDRDIGNVLVVDDGKLRGIVTDRDLTVRGLAGEEDPMLTPVKKLMSRHVVTGEADWNLNKVAKVMSKHQIRRLPITQEGKLVGIVSLGDVALHDHQKSVITESLQSVSTPRGIMAKNGSSFGRTLLGLTLGIAATSALAWFTWTSSGQALRKQISRSDLMHSTQKVASNAWDLLDQAASSKTVRNWQRQVRNMPLFSVIQLAFTAFMDK